MLSSEIIDTVMELTYNITAADPDNALRRARVTQYYQDTVDEAWMHREWAFSYSLATVNMGADGLSALPGDYLELGVQGGLYDQVGEKLIEAPFPHIQKLILQGRVQNPPQNFCIIGDGSGGLQITTPTIGAPYDLSIQYRTVPPTITDAGDPAPFPVAHHNGVLVNGTAAKAAFSIGDRSPAFEQDFRNGLQRMIVVERSRKSSIQKMPRANSGMW